MLIPLKQGLKQSVTCICYADNYCLNVDSIKTRIETVILRLNALKSKRLNVDSIKTRIETLPGSR